MERTAAAVGRAARLLGELGTNAPAREVEPSNEMTAKGYDEAVEGGQPHRAESEILASSSADPVALSEIEQMPEDELVLQEAGRDLRPDTITPAPHLTSTEAAMIAREEAADRASARGRRRAVFAVRVATESSAPEVQVSSEPAPAYREETNDEQPDEESAVEDEKPEASGSAE